MTEIVILYGLRHHVLCCAVLCCAVLCCAVLCCAIADFLFAVSNKFYSMFKSITVKQ
jgi:hypothetical protein